MPGSVFGATCVRLIDGLEWRNLFGKKAKVKKRSSVATL